MTRPKTVEVTDINGMTWYVAKEEFELGGVPEQPDSVIGNYIRGSRGPMLRVNSQEDMKGIEAFLNPCMIVTMKVTYQ